MKESACLILVALCLACDVGGTATGAEPEPEPDPRCDDLREAVEEFDDLECVAGWIVGESVSEIDDTTSFSFGKPAEETYENFLGGTELPVATVVCSEGEHLFVVSSTGPIEADLDGLTDVTVRWDDDEARDYVAGHQDDRLYFETEVSELFAKRVNVRDRLVVRFDSFQQGLETSVFDLDGWLEASEGARIDACGFDE